MLGRIHYSVYLFWTYKLDYIILERVPQSFSFIAAPIGEEIERFSRASGPGIDHRQAGSIESAGIP
jgi:hypothetical protein